MKAIDIGSWEEFERAVSDLDSYLLERKLHPLITAARPLYRGHADAAWSLKTTLERYRPKPTSVHLYNSYLLRIRPAIESYTEKTWKVEREPKLDDNWVTPPNYEFMVYARHNGFPSPLLDWSQSPYIALYFAYANSSPDRDAAVYAYVSAPEGIKAGSFGAAKIEQIGPYATTHARHFRQQAQYTICKSMSDKGWEYRPHEEVFIAGKDSQDLLRKFVLPSNKRTEFLGRLQLMNINAYTLFNSDEALLHMLAFTEITLKNDR